MVTLLEVGVIAGWFAGGFARSATMTHSVPSETPWREACPLCGRQIGFPSWLPPGGRCPACPSRLGPSPFAVEVVTATVFALLAWRIDLGLILLGLCWATTWAVALAFTDAAVQRLPNRLIVPATAGLLATQFTQALLTGEWRALLTAMLAGAGMMALYLLLALAPTRFGLGDVKLAGLAGLAAGWFGVTTAVLAFFAAILVHGIAAAVVAVRRRSLAGSLAHGPAMLAGALLAVLAAG